MFLFISLSCYVYYLHCDRGCIVFFQVIMASFDYYTHCDCSDHDGYGYTMCITHIVIVSSHNDLVCLLSTLLLLRL